jgi:hypothetical protein
MANQAMEATEVCKGAHKLSMKLSSAPKKETKKSVNDYNYYLRSAKQTSDYETTTKFLIN